MPSNTVFRVAMGVYSKIGHPTYMGVDGRVWGRSVKMADYKQLDWDLVSRIKASERRTQVLRALCEKPLMNSELADKLDVSTKWARSQVKWLEKRDLVEDLTEERINYKLYRATERGEKIVEVI
jgi:DNA-binding MarR family transcriptional regulator